MCDAATSVCVAVEGMNRGYQHEQSPMDLQAARFERKLEEEQYYYYEHAQPQAMSIQMADTLEEVVSPDPDVGGEGEYGGYDEGGGEERGSGRVGTNQERYANVGSYITDDDVELSSLDQLQIQGGAYTCECLPGFISGPTPTIGNTGCIPAYSPTQIPTSLPTLAPTGALVNETNVMKVIVPTPSLTLLPPAPAPVLPVILPSLDPCGSNNKCDLNTTVCVKFANSTADSQESYLTTGFCSLISQHLSFTFLEGTEGTRCSLTASENNASVHRHESFQTCLDMCERQLGSVVHCRFMSFSPDTKECVISPRCDVTEADEANADGISHCK
jgi:hypothetical protein